MTLFQGGGSISQAIKQFMGSSESIFRIPDYFRKKGDGCGLSSVTALCLSRIDEWLVEMNMVTTGTEVWKMGERYGGSESVGWYR